MFFSELHIGKYAQDYVGSGLRFFTLITCILFQIAETFLRMYMYQTLRHIFLLPPEQ